MALAEVEAQGVRVDKSYLDNAIADMSNRIKKKEIELKKDKDVYPAWKRRFGDRFNFGSRDQLAKILYGEKDRQGNRVGGMFDAKGETATGRASTSKADLNDIDLPFVKSYIRNEEMKKALSTYLIGLRRECVERDGMWFVHPSYNLNTVVSFRSSCNLINYQNQPARMPELAEIIRRCFIPLPGWHFWEIDYGQQEVRVSACYNKDPVLIKYIKDSSTDMHRDAAADLFLMDKDFLIRESKWAKKTVRDWAKNRFVFPELYGAVYFQCATHLWEAVEKETSEVPGTGMTVKQWLRSKGIKELDILLVKNPRTGKMELDHEPRPGSFGHHVKKAEEVMWNERFKVYTQWKHRWWERYVRDGGFISLVGFAVNGPLNRNDVLNYAIQCDSFQCLLWSLVKIVKSLRKYRMKSRVVGEIHDSQQGCSPPGELNAVFDMAREIMVDDIAKAWEWLIVPLEVEMECSPINESWFAKSVWTRSTEGAWGAKT